MERRPIIYSLTSMHESGLRMLREGGVLKKASALDPSTLATRRGRLGNRCNSSSGRQGVIDAALLDAGKSLKVVGRHGVGYDQIDVEAATARGIQVVFTPGANTQSVAEHVFALMIGLSKHFTRMIAELNAYNYNARTSMTGRDILGKAIPASSGSGLIRTPCRASSPTCGFGTERAVQPGHRRPARGGRAAAATPRTHGTARTPSPRPTTSPCTSLSIPAPGA